MEKLQAALGNARQKRTNQTPSVGPKGPHSGGMAVAARWDALAEIHPDPKVLTKNRIVTREASTNATAFDILRTKILLQMRQNNWTRLAITSPLSKCGKSTTACNLALGLGRQQGLRSMLLDLDLRNPSVGRLLGVKPKHSIGALLEGQVQFVEHGLRYGHNVALAISNGIEKDPTRLLLASETAAVLDEIQAKYLPDVMIFDLPSVLVNDDTHAFLNNVDCALIVARANQTRYAQFDAAEREIAELTNVLGVVLNAYRHGEPGDVEFTES